MWFSPIDRPLMDKLRRYGRPDVIDGMVHLYEEFPRTRDPLFRTDRHPSYFLVLTPDPRYTARVAVPCTHEECRRWWEAAVAYATAVDAVEAEAAAGRDRAARARRWMLAEWRRAGDAWEQVQRRGPEAVQEASAAYEPVRQELRQAVQRVTRIEADRVAAERREERRRREMAQRRRERLAERKLWGWHAVTGDDGHQVVHVFRHDVEAPRHDVESPRLADGPPADLRTLRRALLDLGLRAAVWDQAAIAETERELEGVSFGGWWGILFDEHYRTGAPMARWSGTGGNPSGGTATGGTGGFTGGFSY